MWLNVSGAIMTISDAEGTGEWEKHKASYTVNGNQCLFPSATHARRRLLAPAPRFAVLIDAVQLAGCLTTGA
jgi:hypothetical protein